MDSCFELSRKHSGIAGQISSKHEIAFLGPGEETRGTLPFISLFICVILCPEKSARWIGHLGMACYNTLGVGPRASLRSRIVAGSQVGKLTRLPTRFLGIRRQSRRCTTLPATALEVLTNPVEILFERIRHLKRVATHIGVTFTPSASCKLSGSYSTLLVLGLRGIISRKPCA